MEPLRQESHTNRSGKNRRRLFSLLQLVLFLTVVVGTALWLHSVAGADPRAWLKALSAVNPWVFVALMALLTPLGFPIFACFLFAGAAFGWLQGWLLCLGAMSIAISFGYFFSKTLLHNPLQALLETWSRRLPQINTRHHVRLVLLLRLVPGTTFALQNALLALMKVPFSKYFVFSMLPQAIVAAAMCALGASARQSMAQTVTIIAVCIVAICVLAHFGLKKGWPAKKEPASPTET